VPPPRGRDGDRKYRRSSLWEADRVDSHNDLWDDRRRGPAAQDERESDEKSSARRSVPVGRKRINAFRNSRRRSRGAEAAAAGHAVVSRPAASHRKPRDADESGSSRLGRRFDECLRHGVPGVHGRHRHGRAVRQQERAEELDHLHGRCRGRLHRHRDGVLHSALGALGRPSQRWPPHSAGATSAGRRTSAATSTSTRRPSS